MLVDRQATTTSLGDVTSSANEPFRDALERERDIPDIPPAEKVSVLEALVMTEFLTAESYHWQTNTSLLENSVINLIQLWLFFTT